MKSWGIVEVKQGWLIVMEASKLDQRKKEVLDVEVVLRWLATLWLLVGVIKMEYISSSFSLRSITPRAHWVRERVGLLVRTGLPAHLDFY